MLSFWLSGKAKDFRETRILPSAKAIQILLLDTLVQEELS